MFRVIEINDVTTMQTRGDGQEKGDPSAFDRARVNIVPPSGINKVDATVEEKNQRREPVYFNMKRKITNSTNSRPNNSLKQQTFQTCFIYLRNPRNIETNTEV